LGRKRTHSEFVSEILEISPSLKIMSEFQGVHVKVEVECAVCNRMWKSEPSSLLAGHGCATCQARKSGRLLASTTDDFKAKVLSEAGDTYVVLGEYIKQNTPVEVLHKICGGKFNKRINASMSQTMCPYCSNRKVLVGFNDMWTRYPERAKLLKDPSLDINSKEMRAKKRLTLFAHIVKERL